jgi:hypothetical protein
MDGTHFDALTRTLRNVHSRRGLVRWLGGAVLAAGPLVPSGTAQARSCSPCQKKKHHKCKADPTRNDATCNGDGKCLNGRCNPKPTCDGGGVLCIPSGDNAHCCSGLCGGDRCADEAGTDGAECLENKSCRSGRCVGYRCTGAGTCPRWASFCRDGTTSDNGCGCLRVKGTLFTRQGQQPQGDPDTFHCGDCTTTQDCIDAHGPDAFCAVDDGTSCSCPTDGQGFCALPC